MENQQSLEAVRAWVEDRLAPEARVEFEKQLASDAELRTLAEAYREVYTLTDGEAAAVPSSRLSFAKLEGEIDESRSTKSGSNGRRIAAVAAGLLITASAIYWWPNDVARERSYEPVNLVTIPLSTTEFSEWVELPGTLASYRPVSDGKIQWVRERGEADLLASATGWPLLEFGRYGECGVADDFEESLTVDSDLQSLAEQCVPVIVDLDELEESERDALVAEGYPSLQIKSADGNSIVCLTKRAGESDLNERIRKGLGSCRSAQSCSSWGASKNLVEVCQGARVAESEGRFADAHRSYEELVAGGGSGLLSEVGERGLVRISLAARDALLEARAQCKSDRAGAERTLAGAVKRFENTPHVGELAQVLESLQRSGEFPTLAWATH